MSGRFELIALLIGQFAIAAWLMWRRPYNAVAIVGLLTVVFSYLPAVLFLSGTGFESYSWRNFQLVDLTSSTDAALLMGLLNLSLLVGAAAAEFSKGSETHLLTPAATADIRGAFLYGSKHLVSMSAIYFLLWLVLALIQYRSSGQTITQFFLPIKETGVTSEQSGYVRSLYLAIPSALVVMSYWRNGRLRLSGWAWVFLALITTFSTHQRRELVTTALLILSLSVFLGPLRRRGLSALAADDSIARRYGRRMRAMIFGVLFAGLLLVPMLWYARVYFTSQSRGADVNAFEVRSFSDVLFGSPSTGFPTFVYIQDFVASYGTDLLYLVLYPLTIFVPRALWDAKPTDLDSILQGHYWLRENPSSFWYGEMFYGFGPFAPLVTLLLAFAMYRYLLKCQGAPDVWSRTLAAIFFMQSVTLFKNGLTVFIIESAVLVILMGLAWNVARPSGKVPLDPRPRKRLGAAF